MDLHKRHLGKMLFWGLVTAVLYAAMFLNSELILHLAHTTPDVCMVDDGARTLYIHKIDAATCTAQGGHHEAGRWWYVALPVLIAFAISFAHGAFTGLFWEVMGLKPASRPAAKE